MAEVRVGGLWRVGMVREWQRWRVAEVKDGSEVEGSKYRKKVDV